MPTYEEMIELCNKRLTEDHSETSFRMLKDFPHLKPQMETSYARKPLAILPISA